VIIASGDAEWIVPITTERLNHRDLPAAAAVAENGAHDNAMHRFINTPRPPERLFDTTALCRPY